MNWYPAILSYYRDRMILATDGVAAPLKHYDRPWGWSWRGYHGLSAVEVCAVLNRLEAVPVEAAAGALGRWGRRDEEG